MAGILVTKTKEEQEAGNQNHASVSASGGKETTTAAATAGKVFVQEQQQQQIKTTTSSRSPDDDDKSVSVVPSASSPGPVRKRRRTVNQNLGRTYCWATDLKTGEPCPCMVPKDSNIPYCPHHLVHGDDALVVIDHPTNKGVGKILIARQDLPRGYKMVYWGRRTRWRGCKGEDRAMSFLQNGGVIDPIEFPGQQLQFMACPGPNERSNTKATDECFGKTYDTRLIGREFETSEPVRKNHQLLQWYGSKDWFESRDIPRTNVGTVDFPAPQRRTKKKSPSVAAKGDEKNNNSGEKNKENNIHNTTKTMATSKQQQLHSNANATGGVVLAAATN
jgi:hypothetical protein